MVTKLDRSTAQKTFAYVANVFLVTIIASMPVCAVIGFAVVTGHF